MKTTLSSYRKIHSERGFSMVEVTLALGITGFCLVALFGLLPVGLTSNQNAIEQTAAAGVATGIISDLRASPSANTQTSLYKIVWGTAKQTFFLKEDGTATGLPGADADASQNPRYRATVFINSPGGKAATNVRILLTWPALADSKASVDAKNYSGSFEVVSALDRN